MLVLSRKVDQRLHLGDSVTVTVLSIDGDRVKLGIDAPREVAVLRHEVFEQIQTANLLAASLAASERETIASALRSH